MCRQRTEHLFHNCGHIVSKEISTSNPDCYQEIHDVAYHGDSFCARCIWGKFESEHSFSTALSVSCGGRRLRVKTTTQHNSDRWSATTKDDLWIRRKQLIGKYSKWQVEVSEDKFQEEYIKAREDEIKRNVPVQHQLYFLGSGPFDENFLRIIQPSDVPDEKENCFCGFSVKLQGEDGCDGGGACMLPCGHIFGYNCVLRWIKDEKSNRCPQCASLIRLFRTEAQFGSPEEFLEHLKYDNDMDAWQDNLDSLLNSLLIYVALIQFLFICPLPPWTDPSMLFLSTLWIPFNLVQESNLFQFHRSLTLARFMEGLNFVFPKWFRILFILQQVYQHRGSIFQDTSPTQMAHLKSAIGTTWNRYLGVA